LKFGRTFSEYDSSNTRYVLLNESAIKSLGWVAGDSALGKAIVYPGNQLEYEIIGILNDFHYWSLNAPIEPLALFHSSADVFSTPQRYAAVRINPEYVSNIVSRLEDIWSGLDAETGFSYNIVNDQFKRGFQSEERFKNMLTAFAIMAFTIAMLGLFGIVLFSIQKRMKEISIRKVLGASTMGLVMSTSGTYLLLVLLAGFLSIPITYYFMENWLQNFEYRIIIGPEVFIGSLATILLLTSVLLVFQTLKATSTNPAKVLRDD
jgi:putative ABC transport system permease protein